MPLLRRKIALLLCALLWPAAALAADATGTETAPPVEMGTVTVTGAAEDQLSGKSELAGETLQQLPRKNGSIAEAITVLPRVQAGEKQRTSEQAGEILPPLISISGARPYENYFAVDGVGLNSLLDPLASAPTALDSVPGHPQRTFLQRELIDTVTVYDSNVPARYGRFLGGVVDATTRDPAREFGGTLNYRTTRDEWASQHISSDRWEDFVASADQTRQPAYLKQEGGIALDLPIDADSGLLAAFSRFTSELTLTHLGQPHEQQKTLDNYFLKYAWTPPSPWRLELTGAYTPSDETFFLKNTRDSDFAVERGGYAFNGTLSRRLEGGKITLAAAWLENENSRSAPHAFMNWRHMPSTNWGQPLGLTRSQEGGFGDIEQSEESLQFKADTLLDPVQLGPLRHTLSFGGEYGRDEGRRNRTETAYVYNSSVVNPNPANTAWLTCGADDPACVNGEQFFNFRNLYAAGEASAVIHRVAYYVEDQIDIGPVTLRPGARVSHDDFLGNTDVAHRLAGSWDLFGTGSTVLKAGASRYYGEALMTYKLREAITPLRRETRTRSAAGVLSPWVFNSTLSATLNKFSSLRTPYSDERMLGFEQLLLGGTLSADYVARKHRRQFARERVTETVNGQPQSYYLLNNNGASDYDSIAVAWQRSWENHYVDINYTYTESSSTNESYDLTVEDADLGTLVWYNGSQILKEDLPRPDYYRPHVVNVVYVGRLPWGFTFANTAKYQSGYQALTALSNAEKTAQGIPVTDIAYREENRGGAWIVDWRIDWEMPTRPGQAVTLSLEVNNVFDKQVRAGDAANTVYELGREFWLGMTYRF